MVSTTSATSVTSATATSGGNVTDDGSLTITARGVVWSTVTGPTTSLPTKTSNGTGLGSFSSSLTGLSAGTTYYIRAYATNSFATTYGNEITITTTKPPSVTTHSVAIYNSTKAKCTASVDSTGGSTVTSSGVVWSTSTGPTISLSTKTTDGITSVGTFKSNISGLTPGGVYYVRAYATNANGTAYGNELRYISPAALNCTPDPAITLTPEGVFPKSLPPRENGDLNVNQTFTYALPYSYVKEVEKTQNNGTVSKVPMNVSIDSSYLNGIKNLPAGLTIVCGRPNCMSYPDEVSCFKVTGVLPNSNDQYYSFQFNFKDYGIIHDNTYGDQNLQSYFPATGYFTDSVKFTVGTTGAPSLGIDSYETNNYTLSQNNPNPFSDKTTISFVAQKSGNVVFNVIDIYGRDVYTEKVNATLGVNYITFSAESVEAGTYFYSIFDGTNKVTKKLVVAK